MHERWNDGNFLRNTSGTGSDLTTTDAGMGGTRNDLRGFGGCVFRRRSDLPKSP